MLEHVKPEALGTQLDGATAEIVNDLLRRWNTLDAAARGRLARKVLARVAGAGTDWSTATDSALRGAARATCPREPRVTDASRERALRTTLLQRSDMWNAAANRARRLFEGPHGRRERRDGPRG